MTINNLIVILTLTLLVGSGATARINPCTGKGLKIFFVNGLFNNFDQANKNLQEFQTATEQSLTSIPGLKYDLAWVEGEQWAPLQLAEALAQRGVDDFQHYWLWLSGLEKAPSWLEKKLQQLLTDPKILSATALPQLNEHLALYSKAILDGYRIVVVSHSSGSFYANAALRILPTYMSDASQSSIENRHKENPLYPSMKEMVGAVFIAPPVQDTWSSSPWISFKDDQVLNWSRKIVNLLPGNIDSSGVSAQDLRAHSLAPSYLRVSESREKIAQHIQNEARRLRYPIPYLQFAAQVEYESVTKKRITHTLDVEFQHPDKKAITSADERNTSDGSQWQRFFVRCYELTPGIVHIFADSIVDTSPMGF